MCKANMAGILNGMVCVHTFREWEGKGQEWEQREGKGLMRDQQAWEWGLGPAHQAGTM